MSEQTGVPSVTGHKPASQVVGSAELVSHVWELFGRMPSVRGQFCILTNFLNESPLGTMSDTGIFETCGQASLFPNRKNESPYRSSFF